MQLLGQHSGRALLFHRIESAAMHHPNEFLRLSFVRLRWRIFSEVLEFSESSVQPREIIGRAHPHNAGENMGPPKNKMYPFGQLIHVNGSRICPGKSSAPCLKPSSRTSFLLQL